MFSLKGSAISFCGLCTLFGAFYFCPAAKANTGSGPSDSALLCIHVQEISQCDAYRSFNLSNTIFPAKVERSKTPLISYKKIKILLMI